MDHAVVNARIATGTLLYLCTLTIRNDVIGANVSTRLSRREKRGCRKHKKGNTPYKYYLDRDEIIKRRINDRRIKNRA